MSLESLEVLIDEWKQNEAQELFDDLLARVNTRESSLFLRIRLQILGAKIRRGFFNFELLLFILPVC